MRADDKRWKFTSTLFRALWRADTVLIGHINLLPLAALIRLLRPRTRLILFAHGIEVWGDPAYRPVRRWERTLLRNAVDEVAIVSRFSMGKMAAAFALDEGKFVLFPNAVDLPGQSARGSGNTILAVARLSAGEREKHVDKLVRALPALPDARLVVIGDGPLRRELQVLATALGVSGRVNLPGSVDEAELAEAYARADVFALPSSKEGFGIVYLEAWARGLPVVGSCFGGAGEVIDDGIDGITVDPVDVPALTRALERLLHDPSLAQQMGATGRRKVEQRYSGAAFTKNLEALL
ncbi:glycosyltransferase family 4 protein [Sphingomonas sp. IC4-52]|uniref:glycosyltransferase family 4 protein n=1 Tax=Sphingomonas sp. IC4-52 TaxID=2887202 RepID=UPI001D103994|nr:glycosyltransferase family 4 protein [Sphingomonas sp. IC4-52]MCC2980707.1 glycosyltransferase family 4 protein [Sphingomonas sp. IC4-52]